MNYTIRKKLTGKKKYHTYQIVVTDSRNKRQGKVNQKLGWYNPHTKQGVISESEVIRLLENGALVTDSTLKTMRLLAPTVIKFLDERDQKRKQRFKSKSVSKSKNTKSDSTKKAKKTTSKKEN